jgi:hypothetical protein
MNARIQDNCDTASTAFWILYTDTDYQQSEKFESTEPTAGACCMTHRHTTVRDNAFWRRYVSAGLANIPTWLFEHLASDCSHAIRRRIAENDATPEHVLRELAEDPEVDVRTGLAENRSTPFDVLLALASDTSTTVRYDLADNPHLPEEIHCILAQDENPFVSARAQQNLDGLARQVVENCFVFPTAKRTSDEPATGMWQTKDFGFAAKCRLEDAAAHLSLRGNTTSN